MCNYTGSFILEVFSSVWMHRNILCAVCDFSGLVVPEHSTEIWS